MEKERIDSFIGARSLSIVDAMGKIDINSKGILFIVDENGSLVGSLTDGDIRRWLLKSGKITATVVEAMNPSPCTLTSAKDALRLMKDKSITAIPIIDINRNIVDICLLSDFEEDKQKGDLSGVPVVVMAGGKGTRLYPYTK